MAGGEGTIRRILHFRFTMAGAPAQMLQMMKTPAPFLQLFGEAKVQMLQNVDDTSKFIQVIEYDAPEALEVNRQQIAGDMRVQAYLQAWRALFPGAIEIDVYQAL
jgi:hypothetical protein